MIAIEFVKDRETREPNADFCAAVTAKCLDKGLILLKAGSHKQVIRVLSPLVISNDDLNTALDIIETAVKEVAA